MPPETPPRIALTRIFTEVHGWPKRLTASCCRKATPRSDGMESNPAAVNQAGTTRARCRLVAIDHLADPEHLTSQVAIVGAGLHAHLDQRPAIKGVWPYGGNDDAGASTHRPQSRSHRQRPPLTAQAVRLPDRVCRAAFRVSPATGQQRPTLENQSCHVGHLDSDTESDRQNWWLRKPERPIREPLYAFFAPLLLVHFFNHPLAVGMHETGKIALNHPQYLGVPSHRNDGLVSRHALQRFEGTLF